jgi:hypothetical protein
MCAVHDAFTKARDKGNDEIVQELQVTSLLGIVTVESVIGFSLQIAEIPREVTRSRAAGPDFTNAGDGDGCPQRIWLYGAGLPSLLSCSMIFLNHQTPQSNV